MVSVFSQVDLSAGCCVVSHFESLRCEDEANLVLTGCLAADQNPWTHSELIHLKILFEAFIERFIKDEVDDYKAAYEEQNKQFKEQLEKVTDQN